MAIAGVLRMEKLEVYSGQTVFHATKTCWNPEGAAQQEDDYQEYLELENLDGFMFEADICLSWTFSVTQNKGHSCLATF